MEKLGKKLEIDVEGVSSIEEFEDDLAKNGSVAIEFHHSQVSAFRFFSQQQILNK